MAQSLPLRTAPTIVYLMPLKINLKRTFLLPQTPLREKHLEMLELIWLVRNQMQDVNKSKCNILIKLIVSINYSYLLKGKQSDAEHTPRLRATLFYALYFLPQLPYMRENEKMFERTTCYITAIVPIISKSPNFLFFLVTSEIF